MKIEIIKDNEKIRIYHDPLDIKYNPDKKTVKVVDGKDETVYQLWKKPELGWLHCPNNEEDEVIVRFKVHDQC